MNGTIDPAVGPSWYTVLKEDEDDNGTYENANN